MSNNQTINWPSGIDSFRYKVTFDFVTVLGTYMKLRKVSQKDLAKQLGVTEGRVSQVFNNPGNVTLQKMIEWAHALKLKLSVVVYDDNDPNFQNAPIYSETFNQLWQLHGRPRNFDEVQTIRALCWSCEARKTIAESMTCWGELDQKPRVICVFDGGLSQTSGKGHQKWDSQKSSQATGLAKDEPSQQLSA